MRAVVQRVAEASVTVDGAVVGACGPGLLVLVGVGRADTEREATALARKLARLRVLPDEAGSLDRSVLDTGGGVLVVSQFTLLADTARGNRPSFTEAAPPEVAAPLVERVCGALEDEGVAVSRGAFGAHMAVALVNDGPVTIVLDVPPGGT